jgi:dihydrofolate reductase
VVSKTLEKPIWRNTTIIRDDVVASIRALKAGPGKTILTDGSSQLVHTLLEADLVDELYLHVYPVAFGSGKRWCPASGIDRSFKLVKASPYPTGVVGLRYTRA